MDRRRYLVTLGATATLGGCAGQSGPPGESAGSDDPGTAPDGVAVDTLATGLEVPWGAAYRDSTLYLTERPGRIVRIVDGGVETVVDDVDGVRHVGEGGLLGLAFHPSEPYAYTHQTYETDGGLANRLVRHDLTDGWAGDPLLTGIPGARIHNGGRLLTHDDALYMTCGDAATASNAQDAGVRAGSVLRVTLDGAPHPDNPFDSPVYTYGHRNPQGLAVRDGRLYSTEHGPSVADEINVLRAGENYGWPDATGPSDDDRFTDPLAHYSPTIAPASAAFYDGPIEAWRGDLFFGTLKAEHVRRVRFEGSEARRASDGSSGDGDESRGRDMVVEQERLFEGAYGRIRTTFTGPEGHLHAVTSNRDGRGSPVGTDDRVFRFTPA